MWRQHQAYRSARHVHIIQDWFFIPSYAAGYYSEDCFCCDAGLSATVLGWFCIQLFVMELLRWPNTEELAQFLPFY